MISSVGAVPVQTNYAVKRPVAFGQTPAENPLDKKPENNNKGLSTNTKAGIGVGLAALAGIGIYAVTKGKANKALEDAAKAVGLEDVNLYKALKQAFGKVSKFDGEKLDGKDINLKLKELAKNGVLKKDDKVILIQDRSTLNEIIKKRTGTDVEVPENAIAFLLQKSDNKFKALDLILNNGITEALNKKFAGKGILKLNFAK